MEDLKRLSKKRTGLKASLTRSSGILSQLLEEDSSDLDCRILEERIIATEDILNRYRQIQESCLELTDEQNLQETIDLETEFEENALGIIINAKSRLTALESNNHSRETDHVKETTDNLDSHFYKLPRVEIPTFNGQLTEWMSFIQSFEHSVQVANIPNSVKFTILRNHLTGEALETIKFYSITDENYPTALKTLRDRYGDKTKLVEVYVEKLIDLKSKSCHLSLRQIYDQLLTIVSTLENLDIQRDQYAVLLVPMFKSVFSHSLQVKWAKYEKNVKLNPVETKENRLTLLLTFLKDEVEIIESTGQLDGSVKKPPSHVRNLPLSKQRYSTAAFHTNQQLPHYGSQHKTTSARTPRFQSSNQFGAPRQNSQPHNIRSNANNNQSGLSQRSNRFTVPQSRGSMHPPPCCFCSAKCGQNIHHHPRSCQYANEFQPTRAKELIVADNRCIRCLGPRPTSSCTCNYKCFLCARAHHTLLCDRRTPSLQEARPEESHVQFNSVSFLQTNKSRSASHTILPTAAVTISSATTQGHTRLLLDSGSQRTYITKRLAYDIHAPTIRHEFIGSEGFGGKKERPSDTEVVSIALTSLDESNHIQVEALVVDNITSSRFEQIKLEDIQYYSHLKNLKLADEDNRNNDPINVLIGQDFYWNIVDGEVRRGELDQPVAMKTIFGYVISGPSSHCSTMEGICSFFCNGTTMCQDMENFWTFESMGINNNEKSNNDEAIDSFMNSVQYRENHYEIGLPWKVNHPPLVNNIDKARARLQKLNQRLEHQPELAKMYDTSIQELIDENFVEEVTEKKNSLNGREFYLPHRPVLKQGTSSYKCRPVFDASAEDMNGVSLNDCLLTGPCLLQKILTVLIKFRWWRYGLTGDIKRAFLQIGIAENDRDALRFLWRNQIYRFTKVPFGLCCSPFLLNQTIQYHLTNLSTTYDQEEELVTEIRKSFYVDDLILGADTFQGLHRKLSTSFDALQDAGMTLRNWSTSMEQLRKEYNTMYDFDDNSRQTNVLGLVWDTADDTLRPKIPIWNKEWSYTKRNILSYLAQIYDPLGWLSPLTIQGKLLVQRLWGESLEWDDIVPQSFQDKTDEFTQNCSGFTSFTFPRSVRSHGPKAEEIALVVCCDASRQACGTVIYLRGGDQCKLLVSKGKVAPLNSKTSIPRLELVACLMGVRLAKAIRQIDNLRDLPIFFFTDSSVALAWIRAGDCLKTQREVFINNRVKEILKDSKTTDWHHIETHNNPADLMTRDSSVNQFTTPEGLNMWMHGPTQFSSLLLHLIKNNASKLTDTNENEAISDDQCIFDTVENTSSFINKSSVQIIPEGGSNSVPPLLDLSHYSNLTKVLKITAYVMRFAQRTLKENVQHAKTITAGDITKQEVPVPSLQELEKAKLLWIRYVQHKHFSEEERCLKERSQIPISSSLRQLKPVLTEDGVLRSIGRTNTNPPIVLPHKDPFVHLLIRDLHEKNFHAGVNFTLCELRQTYWIVKGRQSIKRVINECVTCRRHRARPYSQVSAPLPNFRITQQRPFETVGMDFCGPLNTLDGKGYILIFSCAVTRACHLELTPDMSTTSTLQGLRRMISRRGNSRLIICDNARSFKKLRQSLISDIKFYFIPPYSPWFGGFYERLNSSIKSALKKSLGKAQLSFQELYTILTEIESFINHRPITHVTDDIGDPLPLRPVDFIQTPGPPCQINCSQREQLTLRFKHRKTVLTSVWKQWRKQYLLQLHKWDERNIKCTNKEAKIGDVVIINPLTITNKALFPLGRITDVIRGKDGIVRSVYVKTEKGILHRSTKHVLPLETNGEDAIPCSVQSDKPLESVSTPPNITESVHDSNQVTPSVHPATANDEHDAHSTRPKRLIQKPRRLDL